MIEIILKNSESISRILKIGNCIWFGYSLAFVACE
jgi:hypothetical protein